MARRSYTTEAVILGKRNYSEADKIVCVFSKEFGKKYLLAKSARLPKSRKRASLETFNFIRFQASTTKSLDIITEVQTIDSFELLKSDLKRTAVAYFIIEVIARLTQEEERHENLFDLLVNTLTDLSETKSTKKVKDNFSRLALIELGFWPHNKSLPNPDAVLEEVAERQFTSIRVGKRVLEIA